MTIVRRCIYRFALSLIIASDLVSKYKEKIDSDTRQIRQLDIERNEAELAKNKFQVCWALDAVRCIADDSLLAPK